MRSAESASLPDCCDTDANPTWVTYPIPANDDSLRCVQVICGALGRAGEEGQALRLRKARDGIIDSLPSHGLDPPTAGQAEKEREIREREAMIAQQVYEADGQVVDEELTAREEIGLEQADEDPDFLNRSPQLEGGGDDGDAALQSYHRDRPLSPEELAQDPESARRLQDWEVDDSEFWDQRPQN